MNCFEFRRTYLIDAISDTKKLSHVSYCKKCACFALELSRLNSKLSTEFEVKVPESLNSIAKNVQDHFLKNYRLKFLRFISCAMLFMGGIGVSLVYYIRA